MIGYLSFWELVLLFMVPVFIYFFQKFPNFCGVGLRASFRFTTFLPNVVQSTATFVMD